MEEHFLRLALIFWFISSFLLIFLLGQLDLIVHDRLYDFGLQFSLDWAQPYWVNMRLIHIWLITPSILGAIALGFDLWKKKISSKKPISERESRPVSVEVKPEKGESMRISCPSCKRTFSKPLVMLDFRSRKARLINVCPYCDAKLGAADENNEEEFETGILSPDEKVKTN
jgi:uncharacterized Zn-finger protein